MLVHRLESAFKCRRLSENYLAKIEILYIKYNKKMEEE
jgi:hypothetical protein